MPTEPLNSVVGHVGHTSQRPRPQISRIRSLLLYDPNISLMMQCEMFWSDFPSRDLWGKKALGDESGLEI